MEKINSLNQQKTEFSKTYEDQQEKLSNQILDKPETIEDLKKNARIKKQQINLARQNKDNDLVKALEKDLEDIERSINNNSSIF